MNQREGLLLASGTIFGAKEFGLRNHRRQSALPRIGQLGKARLEHARMRSCDDKSQKDRKAQPHLEM